MKTPSFTVAYPKIIVTETKEGNVKLQGLIVVGLGRSDAYVVRLAVRVHEFRSGPVQVAHVGGIAQIGGWAYIARNVG